MGLKSGTEYLRGSLLISMPDMADPRFAKCVILLIFHSKAGAMGVVVNKPAGQILLSDMVAGAAADNDIEKSIPVHFGGPVENERAIIIHSRDCSDYSSTQFVNDDFGVTTTPDILDDFLKGQGPSSRLLVLGYAGWSAGQLETEIQMNSWLTCKGDPDLVFNIAAEKKWNAAVKSLGISPSMLSSGGGSA